jgi:hypothetical protein
LKCDGIKRNGCDYSEQLVEWRLIGGRKEPKSRGRAARNLYKQPGHRQIIRDRKHKASFEKERMDVVKKRKFQRNARVKKKL